MPSPQRLFRQRVPVTTQAYSTCSKLRRSRRRRRQPAASLLAAQHRPRGTASRRALAAHDEAVAAAGRARRELPHATAAHASAARRSPASCLDDAPRTLSYGSGLVAALAVAARAHHLARRGDGGAVDPAVVALPAADACGDARRSRTRARPNRARRCVRSCRSLLRVAAARSRGRRPRASTCTSAGAAGRRTARPCARSGPAP